MNRLGGALVLAVASAGCGCAAPDTPDAGWEVLEPGLSIGRFHGCDETDPQAPSLVVVRADPDHFDLELLAASARPGREPKTVREWAQEDGLAVATNAGMFHPDYLRHVGLMVVGDHVNNGVEVRSYRSALAFDPRSADAPPFVLADLDETSLEEVRQRYRAVVQNLRMVDASGNNVWEPSDRRVVAAALGIDGDGRLLFLFNRKPRSVHEWIECLLRLPLDLERAQYLEGGPEAVLYVDSGERTLEFHGTSSEPSAESDVGDLAWPIPNVLGLVRKGSARP